MLRIRLGLSAADACAMTRGPGISAPGDNESDPKRCDGARMIRRTSRSIAGRVCYAMILAGLALVLSASSASANTRQCARSGIVVSGASAPDIELTCAGAADAIAFLPALGLALSEPPAIKLRGERPWGEGWHSLGQYDTRRNVVELLDYEAARKRNRSSRGNDSLATRRALTKTPQSGPNQ